MFSSSSSYFFYPYTYTYDLLYLFWYLFNAKHCDIHPSTLSDIHPLTLTHCYATLLLSRFMKQERLKNAQRYNKVELGELGEGESPAAGEGKTIPFSADADVDDELDDEDELDMH